MTTRQKTKAIHRKQRMKMPDFRTINHQIMSRPWLYNTSKKLVQNEALNKLKSLVFRPATRKSPRAGS